MATVTVTNASQLIQAITTAQGGDTILLAAGDYGTIYLKNKVFASEVTIASADPDAPAKISQISLTGMGNLTLEGLEIGRPLAAGEPRHTPWVTVAESTGIKLDGVYVHGSLDGDPQSDGYGVTVRATTGVTIVNSTFEQLSNAVVVSGSSDILFQNNLVHNVRSEGIHFASSSGIIVDRNVFRDFFPTATDHADAIQFHTNGTTTLSSDIQITNNVIMQGAGTGMQGIFLRDEVGTLPYTDVLIANNLVYLKTYANGIAVSHGENVRIIGNTVISPNTDNVKVRIWALDIVNGEIDNNFTDAILQSGLTSVLFGENVSLLDTPALASLVPNVNAGAAATIADLLIPGYGYKPGADPLPEPTPTPEPDPSDSTPPVADAIGTALRRMFDAQVSAGGKTPSEAPAAAKREAEVDRITDPLEGLDLLKQFMSEPADSLGGIFAPCTAEPAAEIGAFAGFFEDVFDRIDAGAFAPLRFEALQPRFGLGLIEHPGDLNGACIA